MIINKNSNVIEFDLKSVTRDEINSLYIPPYQKNNVIHGIVKIDGEYYYAKYIDDVKMINELIGSFLSSYIGLDTVDYKIGMYKGNMYALSKLFYLSDYEYYNVPTLYRIRPKNLIGKKEQLLHKLYLCKTDVIDRLRGKELVDDVLKLIAVDLKMGQRDRHVNNVLLKKKDDIVSLAPIYDYGYSYMDDSKIGSDIYYDSPFIILRKNILSIRALSIKYPNIKKHIDKICDIDIEDVLLELESLNNISFFKEEVENIKNMDNENMKILKKST